MLKPRAVLGALALIGGVTLSCDETPRTPLNPPNAGGVNGASAGDGGATASGGMGGAAEDLGGAGGQWNTDADVPTAPHCAYPVGISPSVAVLTLGGAEIRSGEHDCVWSLGDAVPLPLEANGARLMLHFDVNADGVDDLVFERGTYVGTSEESPVLLLSRIENGALSFVREPCPELAAIPGGVAFQRDLNGDSIADFVVDERRGARGFLNRPSGFTEVFVAGFPLLSSEFLMPQAAVMDVAVTDVGGDGLRDVFIGYDGITRGMSGGGVLKNGVLRLRAEAGETLAYRTDFLRSWQQEEDSDSVGPIALGYIAAVSSSAGAEVVGLLWNAGATTLGWRFDGEVTTDLTVSTPIDSLPNIVREISMGAGKAVFVGFTDHFAVYDVSVSPVAELLRVPWVFERTYDHESGGGVRGLHRHVLDVDGDGDDDVIEFDRSSLVVHSRRTDLTFDAPQTMSLEDVWLGTTEALAVAVKSMGARVLVQYPSDPFASPALRALVCNVGE